MAWRAWVSACVATALAAAAPGPVAADVIFHVPEVLVRHAAAPRAVGSARPNLTAADQQMRYEYYVEHSISTADAKKMARMIKLSDFAEKEGAGCGECSKRELEYCETKVLADHCCCEQRFVPEPFPWLPHTCYIGPERCQPLAGNCAVYARLRDCCCLRRLAEHWRCILSRSARSRGCGALLLLAAGLLLARA